MLKVATGGVDEEWEVVKSFPVSFYYFILSPLECTIDIQTDLNRTSSTIREPVILKSVQSQYQLIVPNGGILSFANGESASIACKIDTKANVLTFSKSI